MSSYQTFPVGPYDIEVWFNPEQEIINIKFRESTRATTYKDPDKRGCMLRITREAIDSGMRRIPEAGEYPQITLIQRPDLQGASKGVSYQDGSAEYQKARDRIVQDLLAGIKP